MYVANGNTSSIRQMGYHVFFLNHSVGMFDKSLVTTVTEVTARDMFMTNECHPDGGPVMVSTPVYLAGRDLGKYSKWSSWANTTRHTGLCMSDIWYYVAGHDMRKYA